MGRLLLILMLCAAAGFAQPAKAPAKRAATPAPARWPIESLRVEGNRIFTPDQILAIAGLKVGQMAGRADFDAARDRLVSSGGFEKVSYKFVPGSKGEGFAATFQVDEIEQVYPVEFEELHVPSK